MAVTWKLARMVGVVILGMVALISLAAPSKADLCDSIRSGQHCRHITQIAEYQCSLLAQGYTFDEVAALSDWPMNVREAWTVESVRHFCPNFSTPSPEPSFSDTIMVGHSTGVSWGFAVLS